MSVIYSTDAKSARMTGLRDSLVDGRLEIGTAGFGVVLAAWMLTHSGGTVDSGVWSLGFNNNTVSASGLGDAAAARIIDNTGAVQVTGLTVGTANADILVDSTRMSPGQDVTLSSATLSHG